MLMLDDLDKDLQTLFKENYQALSEEPFTTRTLKLIERWRSRRVFIQRLILALGFLCAAVLSPLLIRGSILLTTGLDRFFELTGDFLATPAGILVAGLCALSFLVFNRRLVF